MLGCPVAEHDMVLHARWVVRGFRGMGVPVVPTCGPWSLIGAHPCWAFAVIHLAFVCWVLAIVCRSCSCRGVGGVVIVWAAGVVSGGVRCVTWQAGDMEGARFVVDVGDMRVWLLCLVSGGCRGLWVAGVVRGGGCHLWHCGGRAESRWRLWDEERRCVTICDTCEFGSMFKRAARANTLPPKFVVYITCTVS